MSLIRESIQLHKRTIYVAVFVLFISSTQWVGAASSRDVDERISQRESAGDLAGARSLLEQQAGQPGDSSAAEALAEFLDRHADPGRHDAYLKWAAEERDPAKRKLALKQAVLYDAITGHDSDLNGDLAKYKAAGGDDLQLNNTAAKSQKFSTITIPGPLPSFARMAALSTDLAPEDLLPALARNVVTNGYEASANEMLQQTEYLRLLLRYVSQARELEGLAGSAHKIVIPACDSGQTGELLKVLGYRMRGSCGTDIVLETVNPTRAFITIDSGFPITKLEQDLRANHHFELPYGPTQIPVLYNTQYWMAAFNKNDKPDFIDAFLSDPSLCRLYLGLAHLDEGAANALRRQASAAKLKIYAHVLDFYGGMFQIRNGVAVVPGPAKTWASLVGTSPSNPGAFFEKLIMTDDGWMASYFDALSRLNGPTAEYLTQPERIKRFYEALRGKITSPGPARPVFRSSTDLLLLTNSLRLDPNGEVHVPGGIDVWRVLFIKHPHGKYDKKLTRAAKNWRSNDDLLEALFALSRKSVENEPLKIFLAVNDIDRYRAQPISAQLASRLIDSYKEFGAQYVVFAGAPSLSEASIEHYLDVCLSTASLHDTLLKANAAGSVQALVELWQILCRENTIPASSQNQTFAKIIEPFSHIKQESDVFDGARSGIGVLLAAATGSNEIGHQQERLVRLLVGNLRPTNGSGPVSPAEHFLRIFDAQRLIPLDGLFALADHAGKGTIDPKLVSNIKEQMSRLDETQSMRGLSSAEQSAYATGYWSQRHIDREQKLNLDALIKGTDKRDARALLAPFVRDSLVGLVYCYYAPPGAQLLMVNPTVVRNHDFIGPQGLPSVWRATEVTGSGWPASAGGRLAGSLVSLPYAIAEAEQNFLMPRHEQALIWGDLVPQMIVDVTVTRWRHVTPKQLRWVSLHIERGRDLFASAALDPSLEPRVLQSLARVMTPANVDRIRDELNSLHVKEALAKLPPSALYETANDPALRDVSPDLASVEIAAMDAQHLPELSHAAIARAFGTPKPTLTHSYAPNLLLLRTFPALMGYSSRILAESWESNNLFYAALADEAGVQANQLDAYVPEWNRAMIENIFATHLEDWPALVRSLHTVADNVLRQSRHPGENLAENKGGVL